MPPSDCITLRYSVTSTDFDAALGLRILINDSVVWENAHISEPQQIQHEIADSEAVHQLTFEMFGKLPQHTKIDHSGNIVQDAMLCISSVELDGIDISEIVKRLSVYTHDFNGTQRHTESQFYGNMGCNGQVTMNFSTPAYIWLLENM